MTTPHTHNSLAWHEALPSGAVFVRTVGDKARFDDHLTGFTYVFSTTTGELVFKEDTAVLTGAFS